MREHNMLFGFSHKVLPLTYDDSLSYYEQLCKIFGAINNTNEIVMKLSRFCNKIYNNVQEMLEDKNITLNDIVITRSYYGDGKGGGLYLITNEEANGFDKLKISNCLTAVLVTNDTIDVSKIGVKYNDPSFDNSKFIQFAIDNYSKIYLNEGTIYSSSIRINKSNVKIYGDGFRRTILRAIITSSESLINIDNMQSQIRYIDIWDFSIDNSHNSGNTISGISLYSIRENVEATVSDFFIKRVYFNGFDCGIKIRTNYDGESATKYFVQYFRIEECQFAYCNYAINANNCYYLQILNSYLQFSKVNNVYLDKRCDYFKVSNTTMNVRADNANGSNIFINDSRFSNINNCQLQGIDELDHIVIKDNVIQTSICGVQFINGKTCLKTIGNGCQGLFSNNNCYSVIKAIEVNGSNYISASNVYTDGTDFDWSSDSGFNFQTGLLSERITASYPGALPSTSSPMPVTLVGQNLKLKVEDNVIKCGSHNRGILLMEFDITAPQEVILQVLTGNTLINTFRVNSNSGRSSYCFMQYLNNQDNISIKVGSDNSNARFNGGTVTFINCSKF